MAKILTSLYLEIQERDRPDKLSGKTMVAKSVYIGEEFDLHLQKYEDQPKDRHKKEGR